MPKKKQKNAYFFYMLHFKEDQAKAGRFYRIDQVAQAASESWKAMTPQQRGPFEQIAKAARHGPQNEVEKYTSQGIPVSQIRKEEQETARAQKTMKETIQDIVKNSYINNTLGTQPFYFVAGNYFCLESENYLPAEIALVKFTFEDGIVKKFHTYVNPEKIPLGFQQDAKKHSEDTHQLPIPPNAKGEKNYALILNEINNFLGNTPQLSPIFTMEENIPMIQSFLNEFCDVADVKRNRYRVFSLHQLFFDIKEESSKNSIDERSGFLSIHIAKDLLLNRDKYAHAQNTACNYHDEIDCITFCALSSVQRWAFTFAHHICSDLNITLEVGKHVPEVNVSEANSSNYSNSKMNETESTVAPSVAGSEYTAAKWEERERSPSHDDSMATSTSTGCRWGRVSPSRDDCSIAASTATAARCERRYPSNDGGLSSTNDYEFPTLGTHGCPRSEKRTDPPERNANNPWNASTSSSDSNQWNQQRNANNTGFPSDSEYISLRGNRERRSELHRNNFKSTRGPINQFNDCSSDRDHIRTSSHRKDNERYHPWKSEAIQDPRRKH